MKPPVLPIEGDLLFEEKNPPKFFYLLLYVVSFLLMWAAINGVCIFVQTPNFHDGLWTMFYLISGVSLSYCMFMITKEMINRGHNDETFKGYYFRDKIIFYRISKQVDEIYTQGLSKEQIINKINETKVDLESMEELLALSEPNNKFNYNMDVLNKKHQISRLEKGYNLIENGLGKPHKFEVLFSEIKYFLNENNEIKLVEKTDDEENNLVAFYNNLPLSKKYKKHQSAIVEFLNKRVNESVDSEIVES
jgi:hypothetical protein